MAKKDLVGPCSVRQEMYMFPERYVFRKDGTKYGKQPDIMLFGGEGCASK